MFEGRVKKILTFLKEKLTDETESSRVMLKTYSEYLKGEVTEEELESNNKAFTIHDTGGVQKRLRFFHCYFPGSKFYLKVAKPLLSLKCVGSMDTEQAAEPPKHDILTKERN